MYQIEKGISEIRWPGVSDVKCEGCVLTVEEIKARWKDWKKRTRRKHSRRKWDCNFT